MMAKAPIACSGTKEKESAEQGNTFMLVFAPGDRPDERAVCSVLDRAAGEGFVTCPSPLAQADTGALEIVVQGLAFALQGLSPAAARSAPTMVHAYGFAGGGGSGEEGEVVTLGGAGHVAAGIGLVPVLRAMAGLAANLAMHLPLQAVLWPPAGTAMEPAYFARSVFNWLGAGSFPAEGLTALEATHDGGLASRGLGLLTGCELQLAPSPEGGGQADRALARALIDHFVREGVPLQDTRLHVGPDILVVEPSWQGQRAFVSHAA